MKGKCYPFQNRDRMLYEWKKCNISSNEWKGNAILSRTEMQWHYVVREKEVYVTSVTMNEREMLSFFKAARHSHILLWETEESNIWYDEWKGNALIFQNRKSVTEYQSFVYLGLKLIKKGNIDVL